MTSRKIPTSSLQIGQVGGVALLLTVVLFFFPGLIPLPALTASPSSQPALLAPLTPSQPSDIVAPAPQKEQDTSMSHQTTRPDGEQTVLLQRQDGSVETLTMADYLFGVVAAEMPASFQLEALKAQAVAARTYTVTRQAGSSHPDGALCDNSACCQAYVDTETLQVRWGADYDFYCDKISTAVSETDGLLVLYEGEPIEALFFAAAAGRTVDAADVWGTQVSYLVGVNSPEGSEVPNYHSQVSLTKNQVEATILAAYPSVVLEENCAHWLSSPTYTASGSVDTIQVGNLTLTGSQLRQLFGLRSATFSYHWEGSSLVFHVTGYGHGVGMSQYGANAMAEDGDTFRNILSWYYTGTTVE